MPNPLNKLKDFAAGAGDGDKALVAALRSIKHNDAALCSLRKNKNQGEIIKAARKMLGYTLAQLAEKLGMGAANKSNLSKMETGDRAMGPELFRRLAGLVGKTDR